MHLDGDRTRAAGSEQVMCQGGAGLVDPAKLSEEGINLTPQIAEVLGMPRIQDYFRWLESLVGKTVKPRVLLPPGAAHGTFRFAHPLRETGLYLAVEESEEGSPTCRPADIEVLSGGPNLGSAGGRALQPLGAVARIGYEGLLAAT